MTHKGNAREQLQETLLAVPWKDRLVLRKSHRIIQICVDKVLGESRESFLNYSLTEQLTRVRLVCEKELDTDRLFLRFGGLLFVIGCLRHLFTDNTPYSQVAECICLALSVALLIRYLFRRRTVKRFLRFVQEKEPGSKTLLYLWLACTDTVLRPLREALAPSTITRFTNETSYRPVQPDPELVLAQQCLEILEARQRTTLGILITLLEMHPDPSHAVPHAVVDSDPRPSNQILREALRLVELAKQSPNSSTNVRLAKEEAITPGKAVLASWEEVPQQRKKV